MTTNSALPRVVAVCGDAGGANAVAPVLERLQVEGRVRVQPLAYRQARSTWANRKIQFDELAETQGYPEIIGQLHSLNPRLLITGTSFNPVNLEKHFVHAAHEVGSPSLGVLDFWSSYIQRFDDSKGHLEFLPDQIAIMDRRARDEMVREGFPEAKLVITGQPAFDDLVQWRHGFSEPRREEIRKALGLNPGELLVLFASQPLAALYGTNEENPHYPGFSEKTILPALISALEQIALDRAQTLSLVIRPHPREDVDSLVQFQSQTIHVMLSKEYEGREVAMAADLVTGMNTILLVEACYLGCVTVSLQPGLRSRDTLPTNAWGFSRGVFQLEKIRPAVEEMLLDPVARANLEARLKNFKVDGDATRRVTDLAYQMIGLG